MTLKYSPLAVANEFIRLGPGVTHMKLQKLVYMAYGAWLKDHDEPFISERPQVWPYGPVFDSLYHQLKGYKSEPIGAPAGGYPPIGNAELQSLIAKVQAKYKDVSGVRMSDITHLVGSPWHQVAKAKNFKVPMGEEIPDELMKRYFRETADMAI